VVYAAGVLHVFGGLLLMALCSAAINYDPAIERFWWMLEDGRSFLIVSVCVGVVLMFVGMLGMFGTRSRDKPALLCFYVTAFVLVVVELAFAGVAFELSKAEVLDTYVPLFKENWIALATESQSGVKTTSALRAKDFLTAVQTAGSCCGFDDAAAQEQNPPLLECSSETACKSIFLAEVTRVVITKCVVIFVLGTIEIISLLLVCGLTCRREKDVAFKKSKSHIGNTVKV
jgi:uncharacterized membrane protein